MLLYVARRGDNLGKLCGYGRWMPRPPPSLVRRRIQRVYLNYTDIDEESNTQVDNYIVRNALLYPNVTNA